MKHKSKYKFFICATEQSGDNIGEKIINILQSKNQNYYFEGVGGDKISPLLNKKFFSVNDFKSIGIVEIIGSLNKYLSIINKLSKEILSNNYDVVITIDSPDFNYRLVKKIKKKGFTGKIIHVVAPTVWAWRSGRAKDFAEFFDLLLVILPFEKPYFEKHKLSTTYIGHPIYYINNIKKNFTKKKYIAFLPGSREGEILSLIKYYKIISDYLDYISSDLIIFIPTLRFLKDKLIHLTNNWKRKPIFETDQYKIEEKFQQTCCALVCSGTASLEIAKRKIPQLIIYKLNFFTEIFLRFVVNVKYANLINIMADQMIIPEITNAKLNKKSLLIGFQNLLDNYTNSNQIINSAKYLDQLILKKSPAEIASKEINNLLFPKPFKD